MESSRADERAHAPGPSPWWEESWEFDFVAPDGAMGGFVRFARLPNQRRAWCWVYVLRDDGVVVVRDHDVPLPAPENFLARSEALWCELVCELPMVQWSIGVEAFGVRLDDPRDALHGEIGTRLPIGLDLEWESNPIGVRDAGASAGYQQMGRVYGDVLLDTEVIAFEGDAMRRHTWGERDWSRPIHTLWCAWSDNSYFSGPADATPLVATDLLDALIPLSPDADRGPVLTRSLVAVLDQRGVAGYGMRDRVRPTPD